MQPSLFGDRSLWGKCAGLLRRRRGRALLSRSAGWSPAAVAVALSRVALVSVFFVALVLAWVWPQQLLLLSSRQASPPSRYQDAAPLPLAVQRQVAQRRKQMDDAGERDVGGCYVEEEEDGSLRWLDVSAPPAAARTASGALMETPLYAADVGRVAASFDRMRVFSELPLSWRDANCYLPPRILPSKQSVKSAAVSSPAPQIPRRLYQTWRRSDSLGPATYWAMRSWIDQNEDFEYNLIDDAQMEQFLEREEYTSDEPHESSEERALTAADVAAIRQLVARYRRLKLSAAAVADLFRVLVLIKHGGVYADMDSTSERGISSWLPPTARSVVYPHSPSPPQWFMAHEAGSPLLLYLLRQILLTVATEYEDDEALLMAHLADISGPEAFQEYMAQNRIEAFCKRKQKELKKQTHVQRTNGGLHPDALAYADCAAFRSSLLADAYQFASESLPSPLLSPVSVPSLPAAAGATAAAAASVPQLSVMHFKDVAVQVECSLRGQLHWYDKKVQQQDKLRGVFAWAYRWTTAQWLQAALVAALLLLPLLAWAALRAQRREELSTGGKYTTLRATSLRAPAPDNDDL